MERAPSATVMFDLTMVALADVIDRPGMAPLQPIAKAHAIAPKPKSVPSPVEAAAPPASKPRAAVIIGQQQKRLAAEKGDDGRPMRPYAIRPGFTAAPAKTCQWIAGQPTPDDSCKCLASSAPGVSYCPDHAARAYRVLPRSVAADFPVISPTA